MSEIPAQVLDVIKESHNILILPHKNADGDCLGSAFALHLALSYLGKTSCVLIEPNEQSDLIPALHGSADNSPLPSYDLVIVVDCSDLGRLGTRLNLFEAQETTISFDHHVTNTSYATYNCVDPHASATGEVIYSFCEAASVPITKELADNLYLAISSDTGCFRQANTTPRSMEIAAHLMQQGADNVAINKHLFARSPAKIALMREALGGLEYFCDGRVAVITITHEQLVACGGSAEECDGLIAIPRSVTGVKAALFLREIDGGVKASIRSDYIDVAQLCARHGGGGHLRAAGCELRLSISEAKELMVKEIRQELDC